MRRAVLAGWASITALALLLGAQLAIWAPDDPPPPRVLPLVRPASVADTATAPPPDRVLPGDPPLPPVGKWTTYFRFLIERGSWEDLARLLDDMATRAPVLYRSNRLSYLHARACIAAGELDEAEWHLTSHLAPGDPYRPLALHHAGLLAQATGRPEEAAVRRRQLVLDHPRSTYWLDTLRAHLTWLEGRGDPRATLAFIGEVEPLATAAKTERELAAARVGALLASSDLETARSEGANLLEHSTRDDPAERVALLLDRPEHLHELPAKTLRDLGESMLHHRRWQRAVELYELARRDLPAERAALDFSMGRARFFAEQYDQAETLYRRAARTARQRADKARALFHAARAAQLDGNDRTAESLLGQAIAVPGRYEATLAALTARIRLHVHQGELRAARGDLDLIRRLFPRHRAVGEGAVVLAMGELARDHDAEARAVLTALPASLDAYQRAEVAYWRARANERERPAAALAGYLEVLRADVPTHFAYLARHRLADPALSERAAVVAERFRRAARESLDGGDAERARKLQTDAVLLANGSSQDLDLLAEIYRQLPSYREVLEAEALPLPTLPLHDPTPDELLAAMGLFDEAAARAAARYPLAPLASALARARLNRLGGASRASIQAVESSMALVPDDFVPQLLPREMRELLYPRYFYDWIASDAESYHVDPKLLLAIMREESRFNPQAKSAAAARGLMQLLLSTARQVAQRMGLVEVTPEDLYDPRLVIQLGAKYLGDLLVELDGDPYAAAAAYNAGPRQARLWRRLAPAPGPDYYLSTVSFAETSHYVRKVLNSYERYGEIYQGEPPTGGVRAEP